MNPTILVVDDDDDVRAVAAANLEAIGYLVLEAPNAAEALKLIEARPEITTLLTDIVMPGMDGFVLAHEAKKVRPEIRVIYTSGYIRDLPWGTHGIGYGPMLSKPWNGEQLTHVVQSVAGQPGACGPRPAEC
jgi:CheY-like chemotaxis protein